MIRGPSRWIVFPEMRRMRGDDPLSSNADLIFVKFIAKSAGNLYGMAK
jgi:hypothetical protein